MSKTSDVIHVEPELKPVTLSANALKHVQNQVANHGPCLGVRLTLTKTGCSGLTYVVDFVEELDETDFRFTTADEALTLFISRKDYPYLKGTHVDFVEEGLNKKFVFDNPNETGSCGCGESFTVS